MSARFDNPSLLTHDLEVRGGDHRLVTALNLAVQSGTWLAVLGRNGAGKTRTLRTLCGLIEPAGGDIHYGGRALATLHHDERARVVTMVTQHQHDAFSNDVVSHVLLGRFPHHGTLGAPTKADREAVYDLLRALNLDMLAQRDVMTLSGGERQRVALAQALLQDTAVLLLDEPFSHQDPAGAARMIAAVDRYRQTGGCVISALHDVNAACQHTDQVLILDGAGGWECGPSGTVINAESVSALYGVAVRSIEVDGRHWFVPDLSAQGAASTG